MTPEQFEQSNRDMQAKLQKAIEDRRRMERLRTREPAKRRQRETPHERERRKIVARMEARNAWIEQVNDRARRPRSSPGTRVLRFIGWVFLLGGITSLIIDML